MQLDMDRGRFGVLLCTCPVPKWEREAWAVAWQEAIDIHNDGLVLDRIIEAASCPEWQAREIDRMMARIDEVTDGNV